MTDQGIKAEDLQILFSINPLAAEQLKTIAATRERDELRVQLSSIKACQCEGQQVPLPFEVESL